MKYLKRQSVCFKLQRKIQGPWHISRVLLQKQVSRARTANNNSRCQHSLFVITNFTVICFVCHMLNFVINPITSDLSSHGLRSSKFTLAIRASFMFTKSTQSYALNHIQRNNICRTKCLYFYSTLFSIIALHEGICKHRDYQHRLLYRWYKYLIVTLKGYIRFDIPSFQRKYTTIQSHLIVHNGQGVTFHMI